MVIFYSYVSLPEGSRGDGWWVSMGFTSARWLLKLVDLAASRDGLDDGNHYSGAHGANLFEALHLCIEVNPRCMSHYKNTTNK